MDLSVVCYSLFECCCLCCCQLSNILCACISLIIILFKVSEGCRACYRFLTGKRNTQNQDYDSQNTSTTNTPNLQVRDDNYPYNIKNSKDHHNNQSNQEVASFEIQKGGEEGYEEKYKEAYEKAYKEAYKEGYDEGYEKKYKEAFEKAYKEGYEEAYEEGFEEGYEEGLEIEGDEGLDDEVERA